jgi:hypothetical protein
MADPTVTDVFNQLVLVNSKLDQVEVNTSVISNLNASINQGFASTVKALETIALINIEAVKLLYHLTQQADTMICALDQISKNTCEILTQVTIQTQIQKRLGEDADVLSGIAESAYPEAALQRQRLAALQAKIEQCCPSEEPRPACIYEPCRQPEPVKEPSLPPIDPRDDNPPPVG